ncbi:hypothetical protein SCHPADRAFT_885250 [Schizopora paradoxa]|uniref:Uncharacterized protein n=1 Tax=Schizopora paradoxa TaxID=27342 RepID=A0A0H2S5V6_9AGAM|nr:hypothetical protein SCHPADRAFT_885250 [Schizopora paradoxa]
MNSSLTQRKIMLKLQPFIKSAIEIANDPELFQALLQLAGNANEISYQRVISRVTERSGTSLWAKHSGHTNSNIEEENKFVFKFNLLFGSSPTPLAFRVQIRAAVNGASPTTLTSSTAVFALKITGRDFLDVSGRTSEYFTPPIDLSWQTYAQMSGGDYNGLFKENPVDGPSFVGNMIPSTLSTSIREEGTWGLVTADINNDGIF